MRPNVLTMDRDQLYLNITTDDRLLWAEENLRPMKSIKRIFLEAVLDAEEDGQGEETTDRHKSRYWVPMRTHTPTGDVYSCSLLTAVWYLHRLGVEGFIDENIGRPRQLVNILPVKYLKSEGIALDIINLCKATRIRKARKKIHYIFL